MAQVAPLPPPAQAPHVPPQNLEAEESVLGAMLLSPGAIGAVTEILSAERLLPREPRHDLPRLPRALPAGRAGRRDHARRCARGAGRARAGRRARADPRARGARAGDGERRPTTRGSCARWRRCAASSAPAPRSHGSARTGPARRRDLVDRAEQIVFELAQQRVTSDFSHIEGLLKESFERIMHLYEAGADVTGCPDRLQGARQAHLGLPAREPDHHRRPARRWGSRRSR